MRIALSQILVAKTCRCGRIDGERWSPKYMKTRNHSMQTTAEMVKEHLEASKRLMKKVLASKRSARAFLVSAGILDKSGKGLAKPYR